MKNSQVIPRLCIIVLCALFIVLVVSCSSSSTEPQSGTLTGKALLVNDSGNAAEDPVDSAGITVAIYPLAVLDTTLVRLNTKYPTIGMIINQQTEFDHRKASPVRSTLTAADGSFTISDIPEGTYNIAFYKDGWGYRYKYNYSIQNGDNGLSKSSEARSGEVLLYRDVVLTGYYGTGQFSFNGKHHVVIDEDVFFLENTTVVFAPGTVIRVNPDKKISFFGAVQMQGRSDSLITITSNDGIFGKSKSVPQSFDRVIFGATTEIMNAWLEFINVRYCGSGLIFYNSSSLRNSLLDCINEAITVNGTQSGTMQFSLSKCNVSLDHASTYYSVSLSSLGTTLVEKSLIVHSKFGLYGTNLDNITINRNYFDNLDTGIYFTTDVVTSITQNDFNTREIGVRTYLTITSTIQYNNFTGKKGLIYRSYQNMGTAKFNNFYNTIYAIDWVTNTASLGNLPATNNWWNTTDEETIQSLILDKHDYTPATQGYDTFTYVDYLPFRTSKQTNAGIQP